MVKMKLPKRSELILLIIVLYLFIAPSSAYANYCTIQFFHRSNLVVAKLENQQLDCKSFTIINKFKNLASINGKISDSFEIVTSTLNRYF